MKLSVRELQQNDIVSITRYWTDASSEFLTSMGVDLDKMPTPEEFARMLNQQLNTPIKDKKSYCIIWLENGIAIGHSNINKIIFREEAYLHLHLWNNVLRKKGMGTTLLKLTLPLFFDNYQLKKLCCEPYALNPAPNKILEKTGFTFIKKHLCIPGSINFEQEVNLWEMHREKYESLK